MMDSGRTLLGGWEWARTAPGVAPAPASLPAEVDWRHAEVPGTAAGAMRAAGLWDGTSPLPLDDEDVWFRTRFEASGDDILYFDGLSTIAEVWVGDELRLASENMFLAHQVGISARGPVSLHICFRSLSRWLAGKRGRARWRPRMIQPSTLRFARTTLLGRMPGWCPVVHPVGPWRPVAISRRQAGEPRIAAMDLRTSVEGAEGKVTVALTLDQDADITSVLHVGDTRIKLTRTGPRTLDGVLHVPDVRLWWPHTHGIPHLYPARLALGDVDVTLSPVGFRTICAQTGEDGRGFSLLVNGETVFCRGACWTTPDLISLPGDAAAYRLLLEQARDAGMNMIRVPGTMVYESESFFALCDALGLMVWQDVMLANFDYPMKDDGFRASLAAELEQFLARTRPCPSLAVLCGGSEVMQQAAMMGQPRTAWEDGPHASLIPEVAASMRPDLIYVANSPCGGDWPFLPNVGVTHYYGVGCYELPLADARRAGVRFTSETLGFANVPCGRTVAEKLPVSSTTDPRWKAATPHDMGVAWDFEDIRDHYLRELFGVDPQELRYEDFERYLDASRAVGCAIMETVFAEWRRVGSTCAGGLVYQLSDLRPGAGWGVIDSLGRPKAVYHALRRAFRPRQLAITDEGLNGLHFHVLNETREPMNACLHVVCLRDGRVPIRGASRNLVVPPRGTLLIEAPSLLPEFFDMAYAYRFGPPFHSVTAAQLVETETGALIADAYHFTRKRLPAREDLGLRARLEREGDGWSLALSTQALAQWVHVEDEQYRAEEDWFHLAPGLERRVRLIPFGSAPAEPEGEVRALNLAGAVSYRSRA